MSEDKKAASATEREDYVCRGCGRLVPLSEGNHCNGQPPA